MNDKGDSAVGAWEVFVFGGGPASRQGRCTGVGAPCKGAPRRRVKVEIFRDTHNMGLGIACRVYIGLSLRQTRETVGAARHRIDAYALLLW